MKRLFCLIAALLVLIPARAASYSLITNVPCSFLEISNAIKVVTAATPAGLIIIGPGDCTLTNTIVITNSLTMRGSGTNSTTLRSGAIDMCFSITGMATNPIVMSDMNWIGRETTGNAIGFVNFTKSIPAATDYLGKFRFTRLKMTNNIRFGLGVGQAHSFGVVDKVHFAIPAGTVQSWNPIRLFGDSWDSWTSSIPRIGTVNGLVVEDCYYYNPPGNAGGNGFFDGYGGGYMIMRHNFYDGGAANGTHGLDSGAEGVLGYELYSCIFTNQDISGGNIAEIRSGFMYAYSNTVYGTGLAAASRNLKLRYYRQCPGISSAQVYAWPGVAKTNWFTWQATGGTANTIAKTNLSLYEMWITGNDMAGRIITIISGTGAGQVRISTGLSGVQSNLGDTIQVSTNWSVVPDNTSVFAVTFADGGPNYQLGTLHPPYAFTNTLNQNVYGQVKLGATMAETLTNLFACINQDPAGAGTQYASISTNILGKNYDFYALAVGTNFIVITNKMDGTNGYPGVSQPGTFSPRSLYTNTTITALACYEHDNWMNVTQNLDFNVVYDMETCTNEQYVLWGEMGGWIDSIQEGRDYHNDTALPSYTPLEYPYPFAAQGLDLPTDPAIPVTSSPSGATITISADLSGDTEIVAPSSPAYIVGAEISFTASATLSGQPFVKWTRNSVDYSTDPSIDFTVEADDEFQAVYLAASETSAILSGGSSLGGTSVLQ